MIMTEQRHEITLPVVFDGDECGSCERLFRASYGMICTAFTQMVDQTETGFERCPRCKYEFPTDPDKDPIQPGLF